MTRIHATLGGNSNVYTDQDVLQGMIQGVADVKRSRDIRRGDVDGLGVTWVLRRGVEIAACEPFVRPSRFDSFRVVGFFELRCSHRCSVQVCGRHLSMSVRLRTWCESQLVARSGICYTVAHPSDHHFIVGRTMARGREKDRKTRKKHRKNVKRVKALAKARRGKKGKKS